LFVAQVVRFFPQFARAKAVVDAGSIGKPGVYRSVRGGGPPYSGSRKWFMDFEKSGGVIMDVGNHDIDFARWCMGEVERVFARGLTFDQDCEVDHALITLRFTSGAIGHIECSWAHPKGQFVTRVEVAGDAGLLEWDSRKDQPMKSAVLQDGGVTRASSSPLAAEDDPYYRELAHFLECLENNTPFLVSPHDGLMAVKVSLAAIESMRRGQPVTLAAEVNL
jgi:predicted dehydrogenase